MVDGIEADLAKAVHKLAPDERVIWTGRPSGPGPWIAAITTLVLAVPAVYFVHYVFEPLSSGVGNIAQLQWQSGLIVLAAVAFLGWHSLKLVAAAFDGVTARYGLTDRSIVIVQRQPLQAVKIVPVSMLLAMHRAQDRTGRGSLYLTVKSERRATSTETWTLRYVDRVADLEHSIIRATARKTGDTV